MVIRPVTDWEPGSTQPECYYLSESAHVKEQLFWIEEAYTEKAHPVRADASTIYFLGNVNETSNRRLTCPGTDQATS